MQLQISLTKSLKVPMG